MPTTVQRLSTRRASLCAGPGEKIPNKPRRPTGDRLLLGFQAPVRPWVRFDVLQRNMPDTNSSDASASEDPKARTKRGFSRPIIGCVTGGCLTPLLLFLFCGLVLRDTGGPLFWPIIAVPLGLIGLGIGLTSKPRQAQPDSMSSDPSQQDPNEKQEAEQDASGNRR